MTDATKLAVYDRIVGLIEDQIKLEKHQREHNAELRDIEFQRADTYRHIVMTVFGIDIR